MNEIPYVDLGAMPLANSFLASLAVGGKDGTLDNRFKEMRGRVMAKTGYIANVSALSGFQSLQGATFLFQFESDSTEHL